MTEAGHAPRARRDLVPVGPARPARLVAVHAHPDDETLATGLALAHHSLAGHEVHVVTATLGEEGEVIPPELAHLQGSEALGPHRHGELVAALRTLGVGQHYLGGTRPRWRDSGMAGSVAAGHPRAFVAAPVDEAAEALRDILERLRPDVVLTYDRGGGYGHPDHVHTHRVTCAAVSRLSPAPVLYGVHTPRSWVQEDRRFLAGHLAPARGRGPRGLEHLSVPGLDDPYPVSVVDDALVTHAVVDERAEALRTGALRHHVTQVEVHGPVYALSNRVAARLAGREGYARLDPATGTAVVGGGDDHG